MVETDQLRPDLRHRTVLAGSVRTVKAALDLSLEGPRTGLGSGLTDGESCHEKKKGPDGSCKARCGRSGTPPVLRDSAMLASLGRAADAIAKTSSHEKEGPEKRQLPMYP